MHSLEAKLRYTSCESKQQYTVSWIFFLHKVENGRLCIQFKVKKNDVEEANEYPKEKVQENDPLCADEEGNRFDYCMRR